MTTKRKKIVARYDSRAEAEQHAKRLRASGHDHVKVHKDPETGKWIVELLFLGLALGILGGFLRSQ